MNKDKVEDLAYKLQLFFQWFDTFFMEDVETEELLEETKRSLIEKINRNNSGLIIITALGGQYDGNEDIAKARELEAILSLIKTRKELKDIAIEKLERAENNTQLLKDLFGV